MALYSYNAQGLRTGKTVGEQNTSFLLDGGNVVGESRDGSLVSRYVYGVNLVSWRSGETLRYYHQNAHGDVVKLTTTAGAAARTYDYDAFGNEKDPSSTDANPFRYCGEYWDSETGTYYLRARYYDPGIGRFTQQDTHWNTANMIYGDNPQKINERQDALGLTAYTYVPQISAIMQSGNLYVYCINSPVRYWDSSGNFINTLLGALTGGVGGALTAFFQGKDVKNGALAGAIGGALAGFALDIGLIVSTGGPIGIAAGIGITAAGAAFGAFVQNVMEQILNGADLNSVDYKSAMVSAGISGGFSLISFGLGKMVNGAFEVTYAGKTILDKLCNSLRSAGMADSVISAFFSIVFVELNKAMAETILNS